jgi:hypothetical protein
VLSQLTALSKQHDLTIESVNKRHARPAYELDNLPFGSGVLDEIFAVDLEETGIV